MKDFEQKLNELLSLANHYPSPHNGQPIKVKLEGEAKVDLYFDKTRGLQSSDISYIFSFVSMGVFVRHLELCCEALGHKLTFTPNLPKEADLRGRGLVKFGEAKLGFDMQTPHRSLREAILFRQTSRKKYASGINSNLSSEMKQLASQRKMLLGELDRETAHHVIWLNQRAVFDDLFDEPVRRELDHWLRYDQKQKQLEKDGLAYDCMELNGRMLKFTVAHPSFLKLPLISLIMKRYYLRTMRDSSTVFYLQAPFATEQQSFNVGTIIMDIWIMCSRQKYYIHPFGTIVSNQQAHRDFLDLAGISNESRESNYVCFIFRAGKSEKPVASLRRGLPEHLILE